MIRYESVFVEQVLAKEYAVLMQALLKNIQGLNDIKPLIRDFEQEFAQYIGVRHALAINSGSDGLRLVLRAAGVRPGDEVIIPDLTYQAVALAVVYSGARPVIADACSDDLNISAADVERLVTPRTRAIIAAHMFGRACNLDALQDICRRRGIVLIEDVCQAESSTYRGKMLGSFGELAVFSFSYYKPLSSCGGGGGMVAFNREEFGSIADWQNDWQDKPELLTNGQRFAPLSFMDLVVLKVKFSHLKKIVDSRKKIKGIYERTLKDVPGLELYIDPPATDSVPQNFVIACECRDELMRYLFAKDIMVQKPYIPLHLMSAYRTFSGSDYPVSDRYYQRALHLPLYSFMSEEKALRVVAVCRAFFGAKAGQK
jgi:dTDP-4-amino-4,6-dideoxygalactose transaminase